MLTGQVCVTTTFQCGLDRCVLQQHFNVDWTGVYYSNISMWTGQVYITTTFQCELDRCVLQQHFNVNWTGVYYNNISQ